MRLSRGYLPLRTNKGRFLAPDGRGRARGACAFAGLVLLLVASLPGSASAHGGISMERDGCKLRLGPYYMHFTGYQVRGYGANTEFCEDIPATGNTIIVMDAVDSALRGVPIAIRIVRDMVTGPENEGELDQISVVNLPPKIYPTGSVSLEYSFDQPGRFVGLVTAGEHGEYVSRFPFSVGIDRSAYKLYLLLAAILVAVFGLYRYAVRRRESRMTGAT